MVTSAALVSAPAGPISQLNGAWHIAVRPDGLFEVHTDAGVTVALTVVLATGLMDELPELAGLPEVWGRDVRVGPCFDGFEVRHGHQVVLGLGERLARMASWVSMWSDNVTVVSDHSFVEEDAKKRRLLGIPVVPAHAAASGTTVGPVVTLYLHQRRLADLAEREATA